MTLIWSGKRLSFLGLAIFLATAPCSLAALDAHTTSNGAQVFRRPRVDARKITDLNPNLKIRVSSPFYQDPSGVIWRKVRLEPGKYGYLRANEILTFAQQSILHESGIDVLVLRGARKSFSKKSD